MKIVKFGKFHKILAKEISTEQMYCKFLFCLKGFLCASNGLVIVKVDAKNWLSDDDIKNFNGYGISKKVAKRLYELDFDKESFEFTKTGINIYKYKVLVETFNYTVSWDGDKTWSVDELHFEVPDYDIYLNESDFVGANVERFCVNPKLIQMVVDCFRSNMETTANFSRLYFHKFSGTTAHKEILIKPRFEEYSKGKELGIVMPTLFE